MLRVLIAGILATANTLLSSVQNPTPANQPLPSKWRTFRNLIFSTLSTFGIPLLRSITGNDALYEYVNTALASSTTTPRDNHPDHRRQHTSGVSQLSRPRFRRRTHHNGGAVRMIKPTIHIHIH